MGLNGIENYENDENLMVPENDGGDIKHLMI